MKLLRAVPFLLIACTPHHETLLPEAKSARPRATATASEADVQAVAAKNALFAGRMQAKLDGDNIVFSPYSLSTALSMAYAGAGGTTATEMATAMGFDLPKDHFFDAYNALTAAVDSRNAPNPDDKKTLEIGIANELFTDKTVVVKPPFLDTLATSYGAGVGQLDFLHAPDASRGTINSWVADHTRDKIQGLLGVDSVTSATRFVLVNAIALKAAWASPFEKADTHEASFTNADASTSSLSFMTQTSTFPYAKGANTQTLALDYIGHTLTMVLVLPDAGKLATIEADPQWLATATAGLAPTLTQLTVPKFKLAPDSISVKSVLAALGMHTAFTDAADFSAISDEPLQIGDVLHKAFLDVDEVGTVAAAATAATGVGEAAPVASEVKVSFDHPFLFAIIDKTTGAVLFQGRVGKL